MIAIGKFRGFLLLRWLLILSGMVCADKSFKAIPSLGSFSVLLPRIPASLMRRLQPLQFSLCLCRTAKSSGVVVTLLNMLHSRSLSTYRLVYWTGCIYINVGLPRLGFVANEILRLCNQMLSSACGAWVKPGATNQLWLPQKWAGLQLSRKDLKMCWLNWTTWPNSAVPRTIATCVLRQKIC